MKKFLVLLFSSIFLSLLITTIWASLKENVFVAAERIWFDRWGRATLFDAYFGFITFFVWVAYKENSFLKKGLWFVLIMCFGNLAMSSYVLLQLKQLVPGESLEKILLRKQENLDITRENSDGKTTAS